MASDQSGSRSRPLAGLGDVPWDEYWEPEPGEPSLTDILTGLASSDPDDVDDAWLALDESQCLLHQGTVYPVTAHAAPFLVRLAARADSVGQADLAMLVCMLATGDDEPYSPAGTAMSVRDAIRANLHEFQPRLKSYDMPLKLALVLLATSFPGDVPDAPGLALRLRETSQDDGLDMLIAACCVLGEATEADLEHLAVRERESLSMAIVRDGFTIYPQLGSTRPSLEGETPVVALPIHQHLTHWLAEGRPGHNSPSTVQLARSIRDLHPALS